MEKAYMANDVIPVFDTGIQSLLYNYLMHLFEIKFPGSQCRSTGMTPILHSSINYWCHYSNSLPVMQVADTFQVSIEIQKISLKSKLG
ncbi:hypothetical protein [Wolbachia endosymbiont (group A) of Ischnus inquisitorius]|uniref:hypothetical protein n=1 Tax=Wolbachia endosymbiont (group A) of Ischnus inquisitorius TaxID=3077922 RepID=UPI0039793CF8